MEVSEIRGGGLSEGLSERGGVGVRSDELVPVLQPREAASGPQVLDASQGLPGGAQNELKKVGTTTKKSGSVV